MRKVDEVNAEAKRRVVLRAAIKCFAEIGLQKASIQDICKMSGMRSGHIYYYFKSKAEIVEAAFGLGVENLRERLEHLLDGDDIVNAIIDINREAESARQEWNITPWLRLEFTAETVRNERLRQLDIDMNDQVLAAMESAAERAIVNGRLDPRVEPATFARAMNLIWRGLAHLRVNGDADLQAYEETIAALLSPWLLGTNWESRQDIEKAENGNVGDTGAIDRHVPGQGRTIHNCEAEVF